MTTLSKEEIKAHTQEQFTTVLNHFFSNDLCFNRHPDKTKRYQYRDGSSCLIGCLIPPGWYFESMESENARGIITGYPGIHQVFPDPDFIMALENINMLIVNAIRYQQDWRDVAIKGLIDVTKKFGLEGSDMLYNASILV